MTSPSRLIEHLVVLDRAALTEFRRHHEYTETRRPPTPEELGLRLREAGLTVVDLPALPKEHAVYAPVAERAYTAPLEVTPAELDHQDDGRFVEVAYACQCGARLTREPNLLAATWAAHAAEEAGIDAELLAAHALRSLRGDRVAAVCSCGQQFWTGEDDSTDPGAAVAGWAHHVEGLA